MWLNKSAFMMVLRRRVKEGWCWDMSRMGKDGKNKDDNNRQKFYRGLQSEVGKNMNKSWLIRQKNKWCRRALNLGRTLRPVFITGLLRIEMKAVNDWLQIKSVTFTLLLMVSSVTAAEKGLCLSYQGVSSSPSESVFVIIKPFIPPQAQWHQMVTSPSGTSLFFPFAICTSPSWLLLLPSIPSLCSNLEPITICHSLNDSSSLRIQPYSVLLLVTMWFFSPSVWTGFYRVWKSGQSLGFCFAPWAIPENFSPKYHPSITHQHHAFMGLLSTISNCHILVGLF